MNPVSDNKPEQVEILVAEDSPTQACRLEHILKQQGYSVTTKSNGRLALESARARPPTLVISDVIMPEMDGYEFCRRLKETPELKQVPVILVTALSDLEDVIMGLKCHADNFILKPYDEAYLLGRVREVLAAGPAEPADMDSPGVDFVVEGRKHKISANRTQILNLLLSTYDAAIHRNRELTRAQEDLQRLNARLESANKELETFSYSVSHDLRAPLRHVRGFVGLLAKRCSAGLDAQGKEYLEMIQQATDKMGRLIDDLLSFSRTAHAELKLEEVDVGKLVTEVRREMEGETTGRYIEWHQGLLPVLRADPGLLRQVFVNLISNAVKYTRLKERAVIEIGTAEGGGGDDVMFVRDNGSGFDMSQAHRLFGVFQRLHRDDEFEGTGIGLATVQRIINRHGGRIWADGAVNRGATFHFTLGAQPGR
ncbi:response regulator [Verrucomicrobium sp. BvORR106]|uniref:response regulator n=1 Tax=Verrucomicrobium sp. BvORR106 TaxID=1403819 RepID=UPI00068DF35E|nr:response regulator [Verrucomicrobium sp. BvORR106]